MKKVLFILAVAIGLVSCKGEDGRDGRNGLDGKTSFYTVTETIHESEWILVGNPNGIDSYYYADIHIPQLTYDVYDYGAVIAYLVADTDVKNVMPFVLHKGVVESGSTKYWTQTYDYEIEPEWMRFYVTFSDFQTSKKPDTETFQIVLLW